MNPSVYLETNGQNMNFTKHNMYNESYAWPQQHFFSNNISLTK